MVPMGYEARKIKEFTNRMRRIVHESCRIKDEGNMLLSGQVNVSGDT